MQGIVLSALHVVSRLTLRTIPQISYSIAILEMVKLKLGEFNLPPQSHICGTFEFRKYGVMAQLLNYLPIATAYKNLQKDVI